ncbi:down syndrome cell adhesion molecule [Nephila pilipes]|uniref:Down syndrome cell adhesion molecule n=1 Tax=Nephila pilipes TaxID=299642 RepID=A0A8X6N4C6_NEPPI|nr:down syndrome cell adhesion molecule [Nephila pilipes]
MRLIKSKNSSAFELEEYHDLTVLKRMVELLQNPYQEARSYTVLRSGELLIHEIQEKDSNWSYRCQTRHRLTGEMVTSVSSGKIVVTEPHASTLPRFTFHQAQVRSEEGSPAQLPCVAPGNPAPTYR